MSEKIEQPVPYRLYSEEYVAELFDIPEDDFYLIEHWRDFHIGPNFINLPTGQVRYRGADLIEYMERPSCRDDPRQIMKSYDHLELMQFRKAHRKEASGEEAVA